MATETADVKKRKSLKSRRVEVLRRTGSIDKNKIALEKPTTAFYWILIIVALFILMGLVMVLSSSSVTSLHTGASPWGMFVRQIIWVLVGAVAMWVTYSIPYSTWRDPKILMLASGTIVGLNVAVIGVGQAIGGAKAWLDIGPFRFQPSEFMKVIAILFAANLLSSRHRAIAIRAMVLWPMVGVIGITAGLCGLQRDYGSALIFAGTMLAMLFLAGVPKRQLGGVCLGLGVLGWGVIVFADRASERMLAYLNLEGTKDDVGYQVYQALLSIANGGWTGTGIGAGTSKWGYVPLAYSDFIFSVIAEEMGLLGTILVLGGFIFLVYYGIQVAVTSSDTYGALVAGGIASWFGIQAIVNIGGVTGTLPMTGLTLPFLSYGGSSMIVCMAAVGLLLNVARFARK